MKSLAPIRRANSCWHFVTSAAAVQKPRMSTAVDQVAMPVRDIAQLNHPNIVTIHDVEKAQGTYALVIAYRFEGTTQESER